MHSTFANIMHDRQHLGGLMVNSTAQPRLGCSLVPPGSRARSMILTMRDAMQGTSPSVDGTEALKYRRPFENAPSVAALSWATSFPALKIANCPLETLPSSVIGVQPSTSLALRYEALGRQGATMSCGCGPFFTFILICNQLTVSRTRYNRAIRTMVPITAAIMLFKGLKYPLQLIYTDN